MSLSLFHPSCCLLLFHDLFLLQLSYTHLIRHLLEQCVFVLYNRLWAQVHRFSVTIVSFKTVLHFCTSLKMSGVFAYKDVTHIPKLDGTNFPLWKQHIGLLFELHDLMELVLGKIKQPAPVMVDDTVSNAAAIKEWKQKDNAARLFIVSTVDLQQQRSLINCKSAEDMWARLCCQFEMVAAENKHILLQRFFEYPYQQEHDVLAHITAIESMACQLRDVGAEISEDQTEDHLYSSPQLSACYCRLGECRRE